MCASSVFMCMNSGVRRSLVCVGVQCARVRASRHEDWGHEKQKVIENREEEV